MHRSAQDVLALACLVAVTVFFAFRVVDFSIPPFEDAAMLMRYADHLARGHGIVWNIGEPPVDGATDFLFMAVVALVRRLGFSLEGAVRFITISSHFATVVLIYWGMRRLQRAGIIPAFLSAAYLAVGPGLFLAAAYFGTPFFVLAVTVAWLQAQRLMFSDRRTLSDCFVFSIVCLLVGLTRPEGVLISIFMLTAVCMLLPSRESKQLAAVFAGIFMIVGGSYFVWRWSYFGHPLPNPFYRKGGGAIYVPSLIRSVRNTLQLAFPFVPAFLLALRSRETMLRGMAFLVPIAGSVGMWVLLSDVMNFGARFQYPVLAICVLSWFPLVRTVRNDFQLPTFASSKPMQRLALVSVAASVLVFVFNQEMWIVRGITYARDGRYDVGMMLSVYQGRGYTVATTEAGLVPLYSKWRAVDIVGLNDKWIAHNGGTVTEEYLDRRKPDIILWHEYFSPLNPPSADGGGSWFGQVMTLKTYAESHDFTLAAVFGVSPQDTHYYYVRPGLPEHDEIVGRIRSADYRWWENGESCTNYARDVDHRRRVESGTGAVSRIM